MAKKRKKASYIQYDYEAAYIHQLEMMDEYFIEQMLKDKKTKNVYATKEIRAGEQLEVEVYPEFTRKQKNEIPSAALKKRQRQAQKNLNEKNSRKKCERVINENFGDDDLWATFTYTDEQMPASMEVAQKNMQNYIRKLNYHRKKQGKENARYVYVTECSEKGRWHHHIVLDGDIDMDTVEKLWTKGDRNEVRRLDKDENGLSGMANYITKEKKGKGQKTWTPSKNLQKPSERVNHYKFRQKDVNEVAKNANDLKPMLEKWYAKDGYTFTDAEIRFNDFNGRFYIYARMRKPKKRRENEGKWKKEKKQKDAGRSRRKDDSAKSEG